MRFFRQIAERIVAAILPPEPEEPEPAREQRRPVGFAAMTREQHRKASRKGALAGHAKRRSK